MAYHLSDQWENIIILSELLQHTCTYILNYAFIILNHVELTEETEHEGAESAQSSAKLQEFLPPIK